MASDLGWAELGCAAFRSRDLVWPGLVQRPRPYGSFLALARVSSFEMVWWMKLASPALPKLIATYQYPSSLRPSSLLT